jgi:hypothetical protein
MKEKHDEEEKGRKTKQKDKGTEPIPTELALVHF